MTDALGQFRTAIRQGNDEEATNVGPRVLNELEERAEYERALSVAARIALQSGALSNGQASTARSLAELANQVEQRRTELAGQMLSLTQGEVEQDEMLDVLDRITELQNNLDEYASELSSITKAAETGPVPSLSAPSAVRVPQGSDVTATVTVHNFGTPATADVTAELETEIGSASISPSNLDGLPIGETAFEFECNTDRIVGEHEVHVRIRGGDFATDFVAFPVVVITALAYLKSAKEELGKIDESVEALDDQLKRSMRPFESKIKQIQSELDSVIATLESGQSDGKGNGNRKGGGNGPEQRIHVVEKHLEALDGLFSSLNQIPDGTRATLRQQVDEIGATLNRTIEALN